MEKRIPEIGEKYQITGTVLGEFAKYQDNIVTIASVIVPGSWVYVEENDIAWCVSELTKV